MILTQADFKRIEKLVRLGFPLTDAIARVTRGPMVKPC